jgi:hydroxypyruvate reductase
MNELGDRLVSIARRAIAECHGRALARRAAEDLAFDRPVQLVGAGKAAVAMGRGVADAVAIRAGLIVTKDEHHEGFVPDGVEVRVAGHPVPDDRSVAAGAALLARLARIEPGEQVVAVLSGGTSSLIACPLDGLQLDNLRQASRALLAAGVAITEINVVRKHLTRASGGRLARACRAPVDVLVISDVIGDDLGAIGSGPFAPDPSSFADALALARSVEGIGEPVRALLERGARGDLEDTPDASDPCFERLRHHLLASHATLVEAAAAAAREAGFAKVRRLGPIEGDVVAACRRYGETLASLEADEIAVGGGEPTVTLPADAGLGGRNQQLALLMARRLFSRGLAACFCAVGSDGGDGSTDAAGAVVDEQTWSALAGRGDPEAALARADAHPLLDAVGALVRTGATGTNVLDLHLFARSGN